MFRYERLIEISHTHTENEEIVRKTHFVAWKKKKNFFGSGLHCLNSFVTILLLSWMMNSSKKSMKESENQEKNLLFLSMIFYSFIYSEINGGPKIDYENEYKKKYLKNNIDSSRNKTKIMEKLTSLNDENKTNVVRSNNYDIRINQAKKYNQESLNLIRIITLYIHDFRYLCMFRWDS